MRATISLPDSLSKRADLLARQLCLSRSQLYAAAVECCLRDHEELAVTAALDRIYGKEVSVLEPALAQLQAAHLPKDEW